MPVRRSRVMALLLYDGSLGLPLIPFAKSSGKFCSTRTLELNGNGSCSGHPPFFFLFSRHRPHSSLCCCLAIIRFRLQALSLQVQRNVPEWPLSDTFFFPFIARVPFYPLSPERVISAGTISPLGSRRMSFFLRDAGDVPEPPSFLNLVTPLPRS